MRLHRLLPLAAVLTLGCSGTAIYPVEGRVVYADGTPATDLKGCTIEFDALDTRLDGKPVSAAGEIDADGAFRLTTLKPYDGAVVGRHRVLIATPSAGGDTARGRRPKLLKRYESFQTSGLEQTVEPAANRLTVTIERAGH